jgi:hypothetical protein
MAGVLITNPTYWHQTEKVGALAFDSSVPLSSLYLSFTVSDPDVSEWVPVTNTTFHFPVDAGEAELGIYLREICH